MQNIQLQHIDDYKNLNIVALDIETTGLDFEKDDLLLVGIKEKQTGNVRIFDFTKNKIKTAEDFLVYMYGLKAGTVITGHNLLDFDIPFLYYYFTKKLGYNINDLFFVDFERKFNPMRLQVFGKPHLIFATKSRHGLQFVDTFLLLVKYDNVVRALSSYGLKSAVVELGLIERDKRIMMTSEDFKSGRVTPEMIEYLKQDLEDTLLLTDFLLPVEYYRLAYTPSWIDLTRICTMGNASIWEKRIEYFYSRDYITRLDPDDITKYKGAITGAKRGLFIKPSGIYKIDINSLYPTIITHFGVHSRKDYKKILPMFVEYLRKERLEKWKPLAKSGDKDAEMREKAIKVEINSAYGFFATKGLPFNDLLQAKFITYVGRLVLTAMVKALEKCKHEVLEIDTDGIIFMEGDKKFDPKEFDNIVYEWIPECFKYDVEIQADAILVKNKKNYIIFNGDDVKTTGIFGKRDVAKFEKDFYIRYTKELIKHGIFQAEKYKMEVIDKIKNMDKEIADWCRYTKTIKKTDKSLIALGLKPREKGSFWYDVKRYKRTGKPEYCYSLTPPRDPAFYIEKINQIASEIKDLYENPSKELETGLPFEEFYMFKNKTYEQLLKEAEKYG